MIGVPPAPLPAADLYETDKEVVVELDLPGFEEKDLALEVVDHTLTVKGEHKAAKEQKERTSYLDERLGKHFERRFTLPLEVDIDRVEAKYATGVLEVHIPKLLPVKARKIEIRKA